LAIQYPKRTEKKHRNRELLVDSAIRLFSTKGYKHTTLEQIAASAGLHVQTLYGHFKNKEELCTAGAEFAARHCREYFEKSPNDQSTFQIWRRFMNDSVSGLTPMGFGEHKREQLLSPSSLLNDNHLLMVYSAYEDLLTEYLARDFQMDPKFDRLPRLVAAMLWSAIEVALKRCAGLDVGKDQLNDDSAVLAECVGVVDDIETIFAGYIKRADNQIA
tara:strand:- start:953 stop:1603 length:651 start_codon:yes stop_codon:yes gene_type:complete